MRSAIYTFFLSDAPKHFRRSSKDKSLHISVSAGAQSASSPAEVAARASSIVTMLPNNSIVTDVYQGDTGILSTVREGSLLVDSSTVDPALSKQLACAAAGKGCQFVDAPVSGQSVGGVV